MAQYEIPPDVLRDLLLSIDGEIKGTSPFYFLLVDAEEPSLEGHMPFLDQNGLLDSPPEQDDGLLAIKPSFRRSLDVLARPIRRVLISEVKDGKGSRSVYSSDGTDVVIAMFDKENCLVSDPLDLEAFRDALVDAIGAPKKKKSAAKPYRIHPATLTFLGAIQGPWKSDSGDGFNKRLKWPVARSAAETRLAELVDDAAGAEQLIDNLVADNILSADDDRLNIHPDFKDWYDAIITADMLEIQRALPPVRAIFLGTQGNKCLIWPIGDQSEEMLLSRPSGEDLKVVAGYLAGWLDSV